MSRTTPAEANCKPRFSSRHSRALKSATLGVVLVLASSLSACGGGEPAVAPANGTYPAADPSADAQLANKLLLEKADMPTDYAQPAEGSPTPTPLLPQIADAPAACKALLDAGRGGTSISASATGTMFFKNAGTSFQSSIASTVELMTDASMTKDVLSIYEDSSNNLCLRRLLEPLWRQMLPGASDASSGTDLSVKALKETSGDATIVRVSGSVHSGRQTIVSSLDVVMVVTDRAQSVAYISTSGADPSSELDDQVITQLRAKARDALASGAK